ncbi:prolyl 4-hydroxylase [Nitrospira sp. KM1]|uniref:2OG-Fe(II) oxygenase n=1 Tax=Nitrospira sp. KM1 TaxID=1936990 RepID=UPI0013A753D8|nr:2OG-Fe(II) oxygenase [Nitrospira sp. KM1]BCA56966.1 prolyl 4-hydroxylase [Nitrospira sp. KM1]
MSDTSSTGLTRRIGQIDWSRISQNLDAQGYATVCGLLNPEECSALSGLYSFDVRFRSRIIMGRHGFGRGEYKYFSYPLPDVVGQLRTTIYPHLVAIANQWNIALGVPVQYPERHTDYLKRCNRAGQTKPTALLLRYGPDDYNCLHQDVYGEHLFPLQLTLLLSDPLKDFTGGEFVMTEQRPRMQSRPMVVPMLQGDAVIFAVRHRPIHGTRGYYRVNLRHGVSRILSGQRFTLGIIFHDAT